VQQQDLPEHVLTTLSKLLRIASLDPPQGCPIICIIYCYSRPHADPELFIAVTNILTPSLPGVSVGDVEARLRVAIEERAGAGVASNVELE
jgi:hypothetical protein